MKAPKSVLLASATLMSKSRNEPSIMPMIQTAMTPKKQPVGTAIIVLFFMDDDPSCVCSIFYPVSSGTVVPFVFNQIMPSVCFPCQELQPKSFLMIPRFSAGTHADSARSAPSFLMPVLFSKIAVFQRVFPEKHFRCEDFDG